MIFMKKIIALYNPGRLANQLWLATSLYAYCLEKGYEYNNYVFYPYYNYYGHRSGNWFIDKILVKLPSKLGIVVYRVWAQCIRILNKKRILYDRKKEFLLPPTDVIEKFCLEELNKVDRTKTDRFYFWGWVFRNPVGLEKYRSEIKKYFWPIEKYAIQINDCITKAKASGKVLVGVHIRQGDFKTWQGGIYYFSIEEVREILDDFLASRKEPHNYIFLICSDEKIDEKVFVGINYIIGPGNLISDLYSLAGCQVIFGPGGTFSPWAAYYGGVNYIRFSRGLIDWPDL